MTRSLFREREVFILKLKSSIDRIRDSKKRESFIKELWLIKIDCNDLIRRLR